MLRLVQTGLMGLFNVGSLVGAFWVVCKICGIFCWFLRHWVRPMFQSRTRMMDRYGEKGKTYALVTGSSDGIGL